MNPFLIAPENHEARSMVRPVPEEDRDFYVRVSDAEPLFDKMGEWTGLRLMFEGFSKPWFDENAGRMPEPSGDPAKGPLVWRDVEQFVDFYEDARIYRLELTLPYPGMEPQPWPYFWEEWYYQFIKGYGWPYEDWSITFNGRRWDFRHRHDGPWLLVETLPGQGSPMPEALGGGGEEPSPEGGLQASVHANLYQPGPHHKVTSIRPADWHRQMQLKAATNTNHVPHATAAEVKRLLSSVTQHGVDFAVAYDVGQGGCHGLCDAQGAVRAYFDFGGGVTVNAKTYPANLNHFCFLHHPPIILSHWDADHWAAAGVDQRALSADWLAPDQTHLLSPAAAAQIAAIFQNKGTLLYYTSSIKPAWYGQVHLELGQGSRNSLNDTGIALTLSKKKGGGGLQLLMPGDAEYRFVHSFTGGPQYHSVVAPHHGGVLSNPTVPVCGTASSNCRMAYSCGPGNTHGHPLANTITWHQHASWHHQMTGCPVQPSGLYEAVLTSDRNSSGLGHILMGWPGTSLANITYHPTCNTTSGSCDLAPQQ
jgi:hypothetical protein